MESSCVKTVVLCCFVVCLALDRVHVMCQPVDVVTSEVNTYNVCQDSSQLRPENERTCGDELECFHGICEQTKFVVKCRCDPGGYGSYCREKCCKPCGDHGQCEIIGNTEYCACGYDYTGEFCELRGISS